MKLAKRIAVVLLSAVCAGSFVGCEKADKAAADLAAIRKMKEKEAADKATAEAAARAEQERAREYFKKNPLP